MSKDATDNEGNLNVTNLFPKRTEKNHRNLTIVRVNRKLIRSNFSKIYN